MAGPLVAFGLALVACSTSRDATAPECAVVPQQATLALSTGQLATAAATVTCVGLDAPRLVWTSSAPSIARVDSLTGRVSGIAPGSATLHARVAGAAGVGADVPVVVTPCVPGGGAYLSPQASTIPVGGTLRVTATVLATSCATPTTLAWQVGDSTIARVDATGLVTGLRTGQTAVRATVVEHPSLTVAMVLTVTSSDGTVIVSPANVTTTSGGSVQLRASAPFGANTPAGTDTTVTYRSADSCIATVSATGLVTGQAPGSTRITVLARRDTNLRATVGVTVGAPAVLRMTLQSITTGTPPAAVDLSAVRGAIDVTLSVDPTLVPRGGRLDLSLGGRLAATATLAPPADGTPPLHPVLGIGTDARDAAGARLYPNGQTTLTATLQETVGIVAACGPLPPRSYSLSQTLTLANP